MIGRIRGVLIHKQAPEVLIEAAGLGYEIQLSMTSFYQLPEVGQEVILYTHFVVREDAQLLFGFVDKEERALFRELIKTNGVGPKLALTILSGMSASQFMRCVSHDDLSSLVKLPGVGRKTAERLVVEMRDRLQKMLLDQQGGTSTGKSASPQLHSFVPGNGPKDEALSALIALGYKAPQASKVVNAVYAEGMSSENLIREALRSMG